MTEPLPSSESPAPAPAVIGGYRIVRELAPRRTYEAIDEAGRRVVLKRLEEDCLLPGRDGVVLHSQIRDRLSAVRELAHPQVANLYSVERDGDFTFMVWEYLDGQRFDEWATAPERETRQVMLLARELVLAVEVMDLLGIVHGQLHAANVIVQDGRVRLTDVSPLLYTDVREDAAAVVRMLREVVDARQEAQSPLGRLVERAEREAMPLGKLATALAVELDPHAAPPTPEPREELTPRGRSLTAALFVALLGILIAWALWQYSLVVSPSVPTPPDAAAEADQPR